MSESGRRKRYPSIAVSEDDGFREGLNSSGLLRITPANLRAQPNFLNQIKLMLPVQSLLAKINPFRPDPNQIYNPRRSGPLEGRIAIVTDVGRGMRWTRVVLLTRAPTRGRRSRVVLTPRRRRQVDGGNSVGDGDKQARSPGRARRKPLKPSRREGRVNPVNPAVTMLVCFT
jgi:hypothetical protein